MCGEVFQVCLNCQLLLILSCLQRMFSLRRSQGLTDSFLLHCREAGKTTFSRLEEISHRVCFVVCCFVLHFCLREERPLHQGKREKREGLSRRGRPEEGGSPALGRQVGPGGPSRTSSYCGQLAGERVKGHLGVGRFENKWLPAMIQGKLKTKYIFCLGNLAIPQCIHTHLCNQFFWPLPLGRMRQGAVSFLRLLPCDKCISSRRWAFIIKFGGGNYGCDRLKSARN